MQMNCLIVGGGARGIYFTEIIEKELGHKVKVIVENFKESYGFLQSRLDDINASGVEIVSTLEEAMEKYPSDKIDAAFIMTPEWTHFDIFKMLVKNNYNIFLEKPITTSIEKALEIEKIAENYNKTIQVGFVLRYSIFYRKIKEIIEDSILGNIVMIQMNERLSLDHGAKFKRTWHRKREYTGGFMNEKCSHDLDLMQWFKANQAKPVSVFSQGSKSFYNESIGENNCDDCKKEACPFRDKSENYAKSLDGKVYLDKTSGGIKKCVFGSDADINDNQTVIITFDDGTHGVFSTISISGVHGRDVTIHGTDGVLTGKLEQGSIYYKNYFTGEEKNIEQNGLDSHGGGDVQVVKEFLECITLGTQPVSTLKDGLMATILSISSDYSIENKKIINVEGYYEQSR